MCSNGIHLTVPMQSWSLAKNDNMQECPPLFEEKLKDIEGNKPNVIIIENTRGIMGHNVSKAMEACARKLTALGYHTTYGALANSKRTLLCAILLKK